MVWSFSSVRLLVRICSHTARRNTVAVQDHQLMIYRAVVSHPESLVL